MEIFEKKQKSLDWGSWSCRWEVGGERILHLDKRYLRVRRILDYDFFILGLVGGVETHAPAPLVPALTEPVPVVPGDAYSVTRLESDLIYKHESVGRYSSSNFLIESNI